MEVPTPSSSQTDLFSSYCLGDIVVPRINSTTRSNDKDKKCKIRMAVVGLFKCSKNNKQQQNIFQTFISPPGWFLPGHVLELIYWPSLSNIFASQSEKCSRDFWLHIMLPIKGMSKTAAKAFDWTWGPGKSTGLGSAMGIGVLSAE